MRLRVVQGHSQACVRGWPSRIRGQPIWQLLRFKQVLAGLTKHYPEVVASCHHRAPLDSAGCRNKRTPGVYTKALVWKLLLLMDEQLKVQHGSIVSDHRANARRMIKSKTRQKNIAFYF